MIYFTSDHHFYHQNVIKYCGRPYTSVEDMNSALLKNWNDTVGPDDVVYYLGDFSMAFRSVEIFSSRLNGVKNLVPGNHDFCHSYHKKSRNEENREVWKQKYRDHGWIVLPEQTTLEVPGVANFNLCHMPYTLIGIGDDKYENWRPKDDGKWLLCGHVHEKWKLGERMINVGVDVWDYKPVPITEIEKIVCSPQDTP